MTADLRSLENALRVLDALAEGHERGVTELAQKTRLSKTGVFRIVTTLEHAGYVRQNSATRRYRLGLRAWQLGCAAIRDVDLRDVARPVLKQLVETVQETVVVGVADPFDVVIMDRLDSIRPVRIYSPIGERAPMHATSLGKIILAFRGPETWRHLPKLARYTARTITDRDELVRQLETARRDGVAYNFGEWRGEVAGIAAPILNHRGEPIAAVNVSVPMLRAAPRLLRPCSPAVRHAAAQISRQLGYAGTVAVPTRAATRRNDGLRAH